MTSLASLLDNGSPGPEGLSIEPAPVTGTPAVSLKKRSGLDFRKHESLFRESDGRVFTKGADNQWIDRGFSMFGKGAFEIAVEAGYQGTQEQFYEELLSVSDFPEALAAAQAVVDSQAAVLAQIEAKRAEVSQKKDLVDQKAAQVETDRIAAQAAATGIGNSLAQSQQAATAAQGYRNESLDFRNQTAVYAAGAAVYGTQASIAVALANGAIPIGGRFFLATTNGAALYVKGANEAATVPDSSGLVIPSKVALDAVALSVAVANLKLDGSSVRLSNLDAAATPVLVRKAMRTIASTRPVADGQHGFAIGLQVGLDVEWVGTLDRLDVHTLAAPTADHLRLRAWRRPSTLPDIALDPGSAGDVLLWDANTSIATLGLIPGDTVSTLTKLLTGIDRAAFAPTGDILIFAITAYEADGDPIGIGWTSNNAGVIPGYRRGWYTDLLNTSDWSFIGSNNAPSFAVYATERRLAPKIDAIEERAERMASNLDAVDTSIFARAQTASYPLTLGGVAAFITADDVATGTQYDGVRLRLRADATAVNARITLMYRPADIVALGSLDPFALGDEEIESRTVPISDLGMLAGGAETTSTILLTEPRITRATGMDYIAVELLKSDGSLAPMSIGSGVGTGYTALRRGALRNAITSRDWIALGTSNAVVYELVRRDYAPETWQPTIAPGSTAAPARTGDSLGYIDRSGVRRGDRFHDLNALAFAGGVNAPRDRSGNPAFAIHPTTREPIFAAPTGPAAHVSDDADWGFNISLIDPATGARTRLTYDQGRTTLNQVAPNFVRFTLEDADGVAVKTLSLVPFLGINDAVTEIHVFEFKGQSPHDGNSGKPAISTTPVAPGRAIMPSGGPVLWNRRGTTDPYGWTIKNPDSVFGITDYVETNAGSGSNAGESLGAGFVARYLASQPANVAVYSFSSAVSSQAVADLDRGSIPFNSQTRALLALKLQVMLTNRDRVARGLTPITIKAVGVALGHGHQDAKIGRTETQYYNDILQWQADASKVYQEVLGHVGFVQFFNVIACPWWSYDDNRGPFRALWKLHADLPARFPAVIGNYDVELASDGIHYIPATHRQMGEKVGDMVVRYLAGTIPQLQLKPGNATRVGNIITRDLDVPVEPALVDTATLTDPGNLGAYYRQTGGTAVTITNVALSQVSGVSRVTITLSGNPGAPSSEEIGFCFGQAAQPPRANIKDSSAEQSTNGRSLTHWIVPSFCPVVPA